MIIDHACRCYSRLMGSSQGWGNVIRRDERAWSSILLVILCDCSFSVGLLIRRGIVRPESQFKVNFSSEFVFVVKGKPLITFAFSQDLSQINVRITYKVGFSRVVGVAGDLHCPSTFNFYIFHRLTRLWRRRRRIAVFIRSF